MTGNEGRFVVRYPMGEWSKADAWYHLHHQMIPGCPKLPLSGDNWAHGWRKCHGGGFWAWSYEGLL
jgi:hypothetical protein